MQKWLCYVSVFFLMSMAHAESALYAKIHRKLPSRDSLNLSHSISNDFVEFVNKTISTQQYSHYRYGGSRFDLKRGIYIVDCSNYVDQVLKNTFPHAYSSLTAATRSPTPNSNHYYHFIANLPSKPKAYWHKIKNVAELRPGDILVFRYKNSRKRITGGHVMMVMKTPKRFNNAFSIEVSDSAATGHSKDTRAPHESGIGIGTLQLKVNPRGEPAAFAWKEGSTFKWNVNFAMARPNRLNIVN